jgi:hypothetical protein
MDVERKIRDLMSAVWVTKTPWEFVTSGGGELTVGTPVAKVSVAGTVGAIWIKYGGGGKPIRLTYGGLGGSVGLSLVPFPGNFSFSIPAMPSAGVIYKMPFAGKTLSQSEFKGGLVMMELCADLGPGASGAVMFVGGNPYLAAAAGPLSLPALIATSNACVRFGGLTATLLPVNASATVYQGAIY